MIIGFSGRKRSGKTTAVQHVAHKLFLMNKSCTQIAFSDELKKIVQNCFGASRNDLWTGDKSRILDCGLSVRAVLQKLGTDGFRALYPDCWVSAYLKKLPSNDNIILTDDVRFINEVDCIHDKGGVVIRLTRNISKEACHVHESEVALDNFSGFDWIIDNSNMTLKEKNKTVWEVLQANKWLCTARQS